MTFDGSAEPYIGRPRLMARRNLYLEEEILPPSSDVTDEVQLDLYGVLGTIEWKEWKYIKHPSCPTVPKIQKLV